MLSFDWFNQLINTIKRGYNKLFINKRLTLHNLTIIAQLLRKKNGKS